MSLFRSSHPASRLFWLGVSLAAALALSGCGRKGALEAPAGTNLAGAKPAEKASTSALPDGAVQAPDAAIVPPKTPFILDKIL